MANLDKSAREALPDSDFAVPGKRKLPIHDATHATLAWDMVDRTSGLSSDELWSVNGVTATLSGTVAVPLNVGIIVDDVAYTYAVQHADTLTSIAAALASLIAVDRACTSSGAVITIPGARTITARVGTVSNMGRELFRTKGRFQITIRSANPSRRQLILGAILVAMGDVPRLSMADGFGARVRYMSDFPMDGVQKAMLYMQHICYEVEYATTAASTAPQAIAWTVNVAGASVDPAAAPSISFNF